jgi:hypothetical protein
MRPDEAEVAEILKENTYPNLDLAYEEAKRILDFQFGQIDGLDVKASVLIASSGVLITIFLTASPNLFRVSDQLATGGIMLAFLGALLSAIFAVLAIQMQVYSTAPSIESLIDKYLTWGEEKNAKYHLLFEYKRMFDHNLEMIRPKIRWIKLSLSAFEFSIVLSVLVFLYQLIKGV